VFQKGIKRFFSFLPASPIGSQGCFSATKSLPAGEPKIMNLFCHEKPVGKQVFAKIAENDNGLL